MTEVNDGSKPLAAKPKRYRSQIREAMNRNVVVTLALEQGFNAYLPVYDGGVDFILHKEAGLKPVKCSSRAGR